MFNMLATMRYTGGSCMVIQDVAWDPLVVSCQTKVNGMAHTMVWSWHSVTLASVCREETLTSDVAGPTVDSHKWETS